MMWAPGAVCHSLGLMLSDACRQFTLNMISNWFVEAANYTCTPFEHGVDEMDFVGLTPIPSQKVGSKLSSIVSAAARCSGQLSVLE